MLHTCAQFHTRWTHCEKTAENPLKITGQNCAIQRHMAQGALPVPHPEQIDSCSASASCSARVTLSPYAFLTAI